MRTTLAFLLLGYSLTAGERGIVGIALETEPDFRVVKAVMPDSPAAKADVRVGDRILAIDGFPTSQLRTVHELLGRASGAADTDVELKLERRGTSQPLHVRLRRIAAPEPDPAQKILPDLSGFQANSELRSNQALQPTAQTASLFSCPA